MIYLDNAATTFPKPDSVTRAVYGTMLRQGANPGRSGHRMSLAAGRIVMNCRNVLSQLLKVEEPEQIVFCFNCTDAINLGLRGLLQRGDHVVATSLDHNAILRPLFGMQKRGLISLTIVKPAPCGHVTVQQIENSLMDNTRLVAMTHVSNVTGAIQPVHAIGQMLRPKGIKLLVDVAQSIGILPVHPHEMQADLVAFPGHKALLGPMGTGALWVHPSLTLTSFREGGTGSRSDSIYQPDEMPDRFEAGTMNLPGIAGLLQGIRFVMRNFDDIGSHELALAQYAKEELQNIPGVKVYLPNCDTTGVVIFNKGDKQSGEVAEALDRIGIGVRAGLHCAPLAHEMLGTLETGAVRVSPGYFNTKDDLDRLLYVVKGI